MMREILLLCRLESGRALGLNVLRHTRDVRVKRRWWLLCAAFVVPGLTLLTYVGGLAFGLIALGCGELVPAYLGMLAAMLIFLFNLLTAGTRLFAPTGLDGLLAMPLHPASIVLARLACLYLGDLALTVFALAPGAVVYAILLRPGVGFYPAMLVGAIVLPILPLVAASAIGTAVMALSARMRNKSLVQSALMVAIVLVVLVGSSLLAPAGEGMTAEQLAALAETVSGMLAAVYPPAVWFGRAAVSGDWTALLWPVGLSVAVALLFCTMLARYFLAISRRLQVKSATHDYRMSAMGQQKVLAALYHRERRRYFASSVYVTNTILAPIMAILLAVGVAVVGVETIRESIPLPVDPVELIPYLLGATLGLMPPTAVALSMEGQGIRSLKAMPLAGQTLCDAKLGWSLTLMLPGWLVASVICLIVTRPHGLSLLTALLVPGVTTVFAAVAGLAADLWLHRFDRTDETAVVKQSASALVGGFAGPLTSIAGVGLSIALPGAASGLIYCGVIAALTALLYRRLARMELGGL